MGIYVWLLLVVGIVAALAAIIQASHQGTGRERHRQVLPAHYSSLLETNPSRYPGYCPACGVDNEPGYRICENCGGEIPTSSGYSGPTDVRHIFNE